LLGEVLSAESTYARHLDEMLTAESSQLEEISSVFEMSERKREREGGGSLILESGLLECIRDTTHEDDDIFAFAEIQKSKESKRSKRVSRLCEIRAVGHHQRVILIQKEEVSIFDVRYIAPEGKRKFRNRFQINLAYLCQRASNQCHNVAPVGKKISGIFLYTRSDGVPHYAERKQKFRNGRRGEASPFTPLVERKRRRAEIKRRGERERVKRSRTRQAERGRAAGREGERRRGRGGDRENSACSMIED